MESLKQAIYGIFSRPTNQPCSGTRPVCLTVGVIHQLSVKSGGTERNCFPYSRTPWLKSAAPLAGKWRFQGGFSVYPHSWPDLPNIRHPWAHTEARRSSRLLVR